MASATTEPYDAAFYERYRDGSYLSAKAIAPIVLSHMAIRSVVDIGCGLGTWLRAFQEAGVPEVEGYDGDYVDRSALLIDKAQFHPVDLREDFVLFGRRFDLAISLEVAEHLPESCAGPFIQRLAALAPAVLFSAAIPGQGGTDHLTERWQDYWRRIFLSYGFQPVDLIRPLIRGRADVEWWYQQNIILYCEGAFLAKHPHLAPVEPKLSLDCVLPCVYESHRDLYFSKALRLLPRLALRAVKRRLRGH